MFRNALARIGEDYLLLGLLFALIPLLIIDQPSVGEVVGYVHWQTLMALAGLMLLSAGLASSGFLTHAGGWLLTRMATERRLAWVLVVFSALLAAVVTNDVALFVTVPLTLRLINDNDRLLGRLVIFQAFAVNAGSALTPVGNPQNLLLWRSSPAGFVDFTLAMLPLAGGLLLLVLALVPLAFSARPLLHQASITAERIDRRLATAALIGYPLFLGLVEAGFAPIAVGLMVALVALTRRSVLLNVDWTLLGVFALMFATLGIIADFPAVTDIAHRISQLPGGWLTTGTLLSQVISNVPAAILLDQLTGDWRAVAWGVNVGGFGLAIGSMANLIALRLARRPHLWGAFHAWSIPLVIAGWAVAMLANDV
ncbi:transporter [Spiribacter vilamensis]|nr:transporter [Spiribacter vilamensis]